MNAAPVIFIYSKTVLQHIRDNINLLAQGAPFLLFTLIHAPLLIHIQV